MCNEKSPGITTEAEFYSLVQEYSDIGGDLGNQTINGIFDGVMMARGEELREYENSLDDEYIPE